MLLTAKLGSVKFLEPPSSQLLTHDIATYSVHEPDEQFEFLHESAIMEYGGVLYASWYNCPKRELQATRLYAANGLITAVRHGRISRL